MMNPDRLTDLLERLGALYRSEMKQSGIKLSLHPVHMEVLYFLSRCNKYSNTPVAIKEYLNTTKGTISQTISLLESKGLLTKVPDENDKRVVHVHLTDEGREIVNQEMPPRAFSNVLNKLPSDDHLTLEWQLESLLSELQRDAGKSGFGMCKTCRFHRNKTPLNFYCELTKEDLPKAAGELICREHSFDVREEELEKESVEK
ncbi:MarR family transcriptional regulator [Aestuariibacter sp. AA17]|uniref:MarR family transcriptional regulator n=1 Tax=Fluctibacter corallii TaxID=2984329 RepID=A0ABT3A7L3_9ALTE|nr:MarR family transcriptional regulator [Aestuariibacter sp. AA17]MCV2884600.1 MarR family transcriptional regulator [Aestuariibacter sp. AA17]